MKMFTSKKEFWLVFLAALVIAVIVFIRLDIEVFAPGERDEEVTVPVSETELPDFARVEERDGERVLVNERDGYEVVLEDDWRPEYYTNVVEIVVDDNYPSGELTASFNIIENNLQGRTQEQYLESWIARKTRQCEGDCYQLVESLVNDVPQYKDEWAFGDHYVNIIFKGDRVFEVYSQNMNIDELRDIITSL